MKDRVEIGHLTKHAPFRANRDQVMDFEIWFKIHTNISNFETASRNIMIYRFSQAYKRSSSVFFWLLIRIVQHVRKANFERFYSLNLN